MEFTGRIRNVMPARTGTSQRGNDWKALPFVFEYKEVDTDPYPDSVVLETFDTNIINGIELCCQKDGNGQLVVQNGEYILMRDIYVRISFRHKAKIYAPEGKPMRFINDLRMNDIKAIKAPQQGPKIGQQPQGAFGQTIASQSQVVYPQQPQQPFPPQVNQYGNTINQGGGNSDDLPF